MNQPASTLATRSFSSFTLTQFLGAFNDNIFKQMILLFSLLYLDVDRQGLATVIFALPFILFSGNAGQLAERYAKTQIMRLSKVGELIIMALAVIGFAMKSEAILLSTLFLMGAQSAYFGPAKYGVIPELVEDRILVNANGVVQMSTFLAIILGQALAGWILKTYETKLHLGALYCVGIAMLGIAAVYLIRSTVANKPDMKMWLNPFSRVMVTLGEIRKDPPLFMALIAGCFFFFSGALVQLTINNYGIEILDIGPTGTSIMLVILSVGIMVGCLSAGPLLHKISGKWTIFIGAIGVCLCEFGLYFYQLPLSGLHILLGFAGFFTGLYYVPIATFMQSRPALGKKGEILAAVNFTNFVAIFMAGGTWQLLMATGVSAHYVWWILSGTLAVLLVIMFPQLKRIE